VANNREHANVQCVWNLLIIQINGLGYGSINVTYTLDKVRRKDLANCVNNCVICVIGHPTFMHDYLSRFCNYMDSSTIS